MMAMGRNMRQKGTTLHMRQHVSEKERGSNNGMSDHTKILQCTYTYTTMAIGNDNARMSEGVKRMGQLTGAVASPCLVGTPQTMLVLAALPPCSWPLGGAPSMDPSTPASTAPANLTMSS